MAFLSLSLHRELLLNGNVLFLDMKYTFIAAAVAGAGALAGLLHWRKCCAIRNLPEPKDLPQVDRDRVMKQDDEILLREISDYLDAKSCGCVRLDLLSNAEKDIYRSILLDRAVCGDGFYEYLLELNNRERQNCVDSLRTIGAQFAAGIADRAIQIIRSKDKDTDAVWEISNVCDTPYRRESSQVRHMCAEYARMNQAQVFA